MSVTKTEAAAINVLMRALTVAPAREYEQLTVDDTDASVVTAVEILTTSAAKVFGSGVGARDLDRWRAGDPVVPTADLFRALAVFRDLDPHVWADIAPYLTDDATDTIAALHRALGTPATADLIHVERRRATTS